MKKVISAVIGAVIVIVQGGLSLVIDINSLSHQIPLVIGLISVWIWYVVCSDQIEEFICRSVLGRNLQNKTKSEKIEEFTEKIIPNTQKLQSIRLDDQDNDFTKYHHYYNWCEIIDFVAMNCCKRNKYIDCEIIATGSRRYSNIFHRKIDILYLNSVTEVLREFANKNELIISNNMDYLRYTKQLEMVENIIKDNLP